VHLAYICIVCHLSAIHYQNRWEFEAVLTKTNLLSFLRHGVYLVPVTWHGITTAVHAARGMSKHD